MTKIRSAPMRLFTESIPLHRTKRPRNAFANVLASIEGNDASAPRNQIYKPFERSLYGRKVSVDIGVIKLHMRQNRRIGKVVQELRSLIEERCIVLITLQQKRPCWPHH